VTTVALGRVNNRDVIVSGSDTTVRFWDAPTGQPFRQPFTGTPTR
jgi:hypothetical protein